MTSDTLARANNWSLGMENDSGLTKLLENFRAILQDQSVGLFN